MQIKQALTIYLDWLRSKRRVLKTLENNLRVLEKFFIVAKISSTDELDVNLANIYSNYLEFQVSDRTAKEYLTVIRSFYKFLKAEGVEKFQIHRINIPSYREKPVNYLERDEIAQVLNVFAQNNTVEGLRDYTFFQCLFDTGCRISEVINLNRDSVVNKQAQVVGKGGKVRTVFFTDSSLKLVEKYLKARKDNLSPLFISHSNRNDGQRITRYWLQKRLKRIRQELKIEKRINPHVFRSSFATNLFNNGADILTVQRLLGHTKLSATQRYLGLADKFLRSKYDEYHR